MRLRDDRVAAGSVAAFLRKVTGADWGPTNSLRGLLGELQTPGPSPPIPDLPPWRLLLAEIMSKISSSEIALSFYQKQLGTIPTILHCQRR